MLHLIVGGLPGFTYLAAVGTDPMLPPMFTCMLPCVFSRRVAPEEQDLQADG
jgi:hypothetical protein